MEQTVYSVIYAIVNKSFSDEVVIAAREAGAKGGTIINARGTGSIESGKFLGVVIEPEKEIVIILCESAVRHDIMNAINNRTGLDSGAGGFVFSLPVDGVTGRAALTERDEQ
jgi:nitrogen regulatory protein PII